MHSVYWQMSIIVTNEITTHKFHILLNDANILILSTIKYIMVEITCVPIAIEVEMIVLLEPHQSFVSRNK